jgi:hypothetical protein
MDSKFNDTSNNDLSDGSKTPAVGFPCVDYDHDNDNEDEDDGDVNRGKNNTYNISDTNITINDDNNDNCNSNSNSDTNSTDTSTEDEHRLYPADCYSFLSLYGPRLNLGNFHFLCIYIHYN